jgi:hypothetical protein
MARAVLMKTSSLKGYLSISRCEVDTCCLGVCLSHDGRTLWPFRTPRSCLATQVRPGGAHQDSSELLCPGVVRTPRGCSTPVTSVYRWACWALIFQRMVHNSDHMLLSCTTQIPDTMLTGLVSPSPHLSHPKSLAVRNFVCKWNCESQTKVQIWYIRSTEGFWYTEQKHSWLFRSLCGQDTSRPVAKSQNVI